MMRALFTGALGMSAQQFRVDVTANNISNVNTTGFKKDRAEFQDIMYQQLRTPGGTSATGTQYPVGNQVGLGVLPIATYKQFSQGNPVYTGNPLDMAIEGEGFFQITLPDGRTAYTRDGAFKKDGNGNVLTNDGYFINPPITIPPDATEIVITRDGSFNVRIAESPQLTNLGQVQLARFVNPAGLTFIGQNLFLESEASGAPNIGTPNQGAYGGLRQNFIENSNVNIADELIQLILGQRAFEMNSKSVQTSDEMLGTAVNLKR